MKSKNKPLINKNFNKINQTNINLEIMNNQKTKTIRNLILTICFLFTIQLSFAQLRVTKPSGNVGIGLETPIQKLDVNGNAFIRGGSFLCGADQAGNSTMTIGHFRTIDGLATINFYSKKDQSFKTRLLSATNGAGLDYSALMHYGNGNLVFRTWDSNSNINFITKKSNGSPSVSLVITPEGSIGIGTQNPEAKLHVNGDAKKNGGGEWATTSDKRTKKNINKYNLGLEEVLRLNPVTFKYNGKAGISNTEKTYVGLIAQEFAEIEPSAIQTFNFTEEGSNKTEEYLSLDASSIKYMLVNAIKEQQNLIEAQQSNLEKQQTLAQKQQTEIENLKVQIAELVNNGSSTFPTNNEMNVLLEGTDTKKALLAQNSPNPFTSSTRIEYLIPENSRNARISFRDMTGKEIKRIDLTHEGIGAIELTAKDLAAGIYAYVLYVNGSIAASKKMILKE